VGIYSEFNKNFWILFNGAYYVYVATLRSYMQITSRVKAFVVDHHSITL